MVKKLLLALYFVCFSFWVNAQEKDYYSALDQFLEHKTERNFQLLVNTSDTLQTPNPESKLAKVILDCNIAYYLEKKGLLHQAISRYKNAIDLLAKSKLMDYDIVNYAMIPLGNLYTKTNAYQEAENLIKGYISLSRKQNNTQNLRAGLINLSVPLQNQGKYQQAIALLEEAKVLAPQNINIKINLATNYVSIGDYKKANDIALQVLKEDSSQINAYKLLSQIALLENDTNKAVTLLLTALQIQQKQPTINYRNLAKTRITLAQAYLINQEQDLVIQQLDKVYAHWITQKIPGALPKTATLIAENTLLDALDLHAQVLLQKQDPKMALLAYRLAAQVSDLLNQPQLSQQSRLVLEASDKKRSESRIAILYNLYQETNDIAQLEKALYISDRSKSSLLSEATRDQTLLNRYTQDSLVIIFRQQQENIAQLERLLVEYRNSSQIEILEKTQNLYTKELLAKKKSRELLSKKYPELNRIKSPITLKDLQAKTLYTKNTVVSYFFGFKSVYQFVIGPDTLEFIQLAQNQETRDQLFNNCALYNTYFTNASAILNDPSGFCQQSLNLYQKLRLPKSQQLVIIPDGILSFIPFKTLLTQKATSTKFETMPFLVRDSRVSWQLSLYEYLKPYTSIIKNASVLGVFPVFDTTDLALTHSKDEAAAIQNTFPSALLMDKMATVDNAFAKASQHPILHFSTHAIGGSFTRPASIEFIDGSLYLNELYSKNLQPDLVVLSACETGVGPIATGEGTIHLARGFQYAGAKSVLFSLWKVNDKATAQLMKEFYAALKKTNNRDQSLQSSQLAYLNDKKNTNIKKSPYYWGAFVYYGPADITPQSHYGLWLWVLGVFGVFLTLLLIRKYGKPARIPFRKRIQENKT